MRDAIALASFYLMKFGTNNFLRVGSFALACLFATSAQAVVVTVNSVQYDVSTIFGTYPSLVSTLQSQPWYGSPTAADNFAYAVSGQLGFPAPGNTTFGPFFAFAVSANSLDSAAASSIFSGIANTSFVGFVGGTTDPHTFAIIQPTSGVPDAGVTAAMLGLALVGLTAVRRRLAS
jgi:hypothetical protein